MKYGEGSIQGFTLMEIVIVVGIVAILALAAVHLLSTFDDRHSELEGARVKAIIHHARSLAISRKEIFRITFDTANDTVLEVVRNCIAPLGVAVGVARLRGAGRIRRRQQHGTVADVVDLLVEPVIAGCHRAIVG